MRHLYSIRHTLTKLILCTFIVILLIPISEVWAEPKESHPGLQKHVPTRIDWLTTTLQASLRVEMTEENKFVLNITSPDSETILIHVRHLPNVNREIMNIYIDAARKVIQIVAKKYGWSKWLKVREDVQIGKAD
jgi:hypothetical protein